MIKPTTTSVSHPSLTLRKPPSCRVTKATTSDRSPGDAYPRLFIVHNVTKPGVFKVARKPLLIGHPVLDIISGSENRYRFRFTGEYEGMVEVCFFKPSTEIPVGLELQVLSRSMNTGPRVRWGSITSSASVAGLVCGQDEALSQYVFDYSLID